MDKIVFDTDAFQEYMDWQTQDKKTLKKINELIIDIKRNGLLKGIGKPERLKHIDGYSRHIDHVTRLIYSYDEQQNLRIISCKGHYI
ncbi:MAG: Txe/YoeB family addiction module toxin [Treponema sp.]|nr:Txe/YoeB family addiction module toxin [Treponema sp.]